MKDGIENVPKSMLKTLNNISFFIDDKIYINKIILDDFYKILVSNGIIGSVNDLCNFNEIMNKLKEYQKLFYNNELNLECLIKILYNVRRVESLEDDKYKFDMETIKRIIKNSLWLSANDDEMVLLQAIFNKKVIIKSVSIGEIEKYLEGYINKNELELNIERTKLIKVLKRISNK